MSVISPTSPAVVPEQRSSTGRIHLPGRSLATPRGNLLLSQPGEGWGLGLVSQGQVSAMLLKVLQGTHGPHNEKVPGPTGQECPRWKPCISKTWIWIQALPKPVFSSWTSYLHSLKLSSQDCKIGMIIIFPPCSFRVWLFEPNEVEHMYWLLGFFIYLLYK